MLRYLSLFAVALGVVSVVATPDTADARPQYLKAFATQYADLKEQALDQKCNICHFGTTKKNHNDYGLAMKKHFGEEENVKDAKKIGESYVAIEKEKSSTEGKTFGDLIKEGKLPGKNPE